MHIVDYEEESLLGHLIQSPVLPRGLLGSHPPSAAAELLQGSPPPGEPSSPLKKGVNPTPHVN